MAKRAKGAAESKESAPPRPVSEQIDRELAAKAIQKRQRGETPTAQELAGLRRWEKQQEEETRWRIYRSIPQKHWLEMAGAGRQSKTVNEQAERYGIPFGGKDISLPDVVRALHEFLKANKYRLAKDGEEDAGRESSARRRYNLAAAEMIELDLAERKGRLLPRDEVHELLGRVGVLVRAAGEVLQQTFGREAHRILGEALDDADHDIRSYFNAKKREAAEGGAEARRTDAQAAAAKSH